MKTLSTKQKIEAVVAFALIALVVILSVAGVFASAVVVAKLFIGLGLGYALTRGDYGFAGLSNKTCRTGSTKLIRALMLMFVVSALIVAGLLIGGKITVANLWVNPISWGLIAGGILFGVGMAFSSCCATGVCQDVPVGFSRAMITLVFFGVGVFLGFPLMTSGFVQNTLFNTASDANGVWMADWFAWDGTGGILGAVLITVLFAALVGTLAKWYEKKIAKNFPAVKAEVVATEEASVWERFFVKKWSLTQTAIVISVLFGALYAVANTGWGASTVYGQWFGAILVNVFGADAQALSDFTNNVQSAGAFTQNFWGATGWLQNIGIILGAFIGLLLSGKFSDTFKAGLKIKPLEIALFAAGGLLLGFGTRLSMGCNVGALYTPIADFSLAGWIYFFALFGGGYLGNKIRKSFYQKVDPTKL